MMTRQKPHNHRQTRRKIDLVFSDRLGPSLYPGLIEAIDGCAQCADYYHRMQTVETAFCTAPDGVTPFALDRVEARVLNRAAVRPDMRSKFVKRWGPMLAAALALTLLVWAFLPTTHRTSRVAVPAEVETVPLELTARGDGDAKRSHGGIRVFQVLTDPSRVREKKQLTVADVITFTYTRVPEKSGYLLLFGLQQAGDVLWYYPDYGEHQSIPIKGDTVDEPLGDGIDLSVNHQAGWLRIVAVFSDTPLRVEEMEFRMASLREKEMDLKQIPTLVEREGDTTLLEYSVFLELLREIE